MPFQSEACVPMQSETEWKAKPGKPSPIGIARRYRSSLASVLVAAVLVAATVSCANGQLVLTAPPDPPPEAFDVWDQLPGIWQDWYTNDYDPWADAVCRALADTETCGTFAEEIPE